MNIKLRRAKRRDAKERNWMFIVMPNDHLIYIAYNSASVLNMLLTLFLEHCSKPKNTVCTTFNFKERSFIMQLPPSTVCKFSSMIYLHPHILIHIYLEVIIALIYEPAMWWLRLTSPRASRMFRRISIEDNVLCSYNTHFKCLISSISSLRL